MSTKERMRVDAGATEIGRIRIASGLSRAAFARKYEIPLRTLEAWERQIREPAAYFVRLLERVVREDFAENREE